MVSSPTKGHPKGKAVVATTLGEVASRNVMGREAGLAVFEK